MDESATPLDDPERWLPAAEYEGLYEVSSLGRVRSLPRPGTLGGILKPQRKRYFTVNLYRDGKMRTVTVHSLVARAFLKPRPEGHQVCHGPAGCYVNAAANLSYGTAAKNLGPDKYRDGTMQAGVRNGNARLTDEIVSQCRTRIAAGESRRALAREFGVSKPTMDHAVKGATWQHVPVIAVPARPPRDMAQYAYVQIAGRMESAIGAGGLAAGTKLPSLREIAEQNDVSMGTAFKVVALLRAGGLIVTRGFSGSYVLPPDERVPQD
jgi:hypothetical protein